MKFIGIIPARYASTRFPGKPLAMLGGQTVIERVYRQVEKVLDDVCVATDDQRILDAVVGFGGQAVMTSPNHRSGTDRIRQAYDLLDADHDVVVNIQGDEPFIRPEQIRSLCTCFDEADTQIATLVKPFTAADGLEALDNPNSPKVVVDDRWHALYFSRSVVPYLRGVERNEWLQHHTFLRHIGLYAYRADVLRRITELPPSPLEQAESLEQLRWLQAGYTIKVATTDTDKTPRDVA